MTNPITAPMTTDEIKRLTDDMGYITGTVRVDLSDIIDNDLEGVLDLLSELLTDTPVEVTDLTYKVVGHDGDTLLIEVEGNADQVFERADDEPTA